MDLPDLRFTDRLIPIPNMFRDFEGQLFEQCLVCDQELLESNVPYFVERSFVHTEPIAEFAICMQCHQSIGSELSRETFVRLKAHFEERIDVVDRRQSLLQNSTDDIEPWVNECLLTKQSRADSRAYSIGGQCYGPHLVLSFMPYMISDAGMETVQPLFSKKSRDAHDDFTDQFLGLPPELRDLPTPMLL